ncbi:hypothetical protein HWD99_07885 [Microbacterium sp. C5A9]|uniref:hypothetical protein n=1 Tax=Microbacterium sp. C5A9 TaxID=2736663 RepID=UPI001F51CFD9|nr:hypothetical protein [Microbacterium sp. C5A9]MCI1018538.1 hypothetical protein [Microbacterium sp. C5A9]
MDDLSESAEHLVALLLESDDQTRVRSAAWDLLDAALDDPAELRAAQKAGSHALCEVFEALAVVIREILSVPDLLVDVILEQLPVHWLPRTAVKVIVKKLLAAVLAADPSVTALCALRAKCSLLAVGLCPDTDQHSSLAQTCALPLAKTIVGDADSGSVLS